MWLPALCWSRPSAKDVASSLAACRGFNYEEKYVGATAEAPFSYETIEQLKKGGFSINHSRVKLGSGLQTFLKGKERLQNWRHIQLGWVSTDPTTSIRVGAKFGIHVHELVTWLINPLQILYVTDTQTDSTADTSLGEQMVSRAGVGKPSKSSARSTFAFAGGTLNGHLLAGEERFAIEWDREDSNMVWYDILSFSKPAHLLSIVGLPIVQFQQKAFAKCSTEAMVREVKADV